MKPLKYLVWHYKSAWYKKYHRHGPLNHDKHRIKRPWKSNHDLYVIFLYSLHATKYAISCLSRLKLCSWELPPPFCLRVTFHHYFKCASTRGAGAAGGGPGSVPIASQQKQLCQTQLAASEGETPLSTVILQLFTSCPCLCLSHLINPHSNKGKQTPAPTKQRPALLCWHGVCAKAPAQGVSDSQARLSFIYRR